MRKILNAIVLLSVLSLCLVSLLTYQGKCQELSKIEVLFSPEQGVEILKTLKDAIQDAQVRVYIIIYSFTLDELAQVIIEKHREGLDIKIVMDRSQASSGWAVTEKLRQAGIPLVIKTGTEGGYMHIKALIADDTLFTGSYNYSKNATYHSDENFLIITDKAVVKAHLVKFNQLWEEELSVVSPKITEPKQRAPPDIIVYITKTGKKYHRLGCRYLSKSCISISLTKAKQQGYTPCKVCKPPP